MTDRRQTDGRTTTYSEREREFTFAKNGINILIIVVITIFIIINHQSLSSLLQYDQMITSATLMFTSNVHVFNTVGAHYNAPVRCLATQVAVITAAAIT